MFEASQFIRDQDGKAINAGHSNSVVPFDWDADGDLDLVWGIRIDKVGIKIAINIGSKTNPQFTSAQHIEVNKDTPYNMKSTNTAPIDWDGDGLFDLVCGTDNGSIIWYKNTGKKGIPDFTSLPEFLIKNNYNWVTKFGELKLHGARTKVFPYDYNKDGKLDLLVGDIISFTEAKPELSSEDKIKVEALSEKMYALFDEVQKYYDLNEEATKEIMQKNPDLTHNEASGMAFNEMSKENKENYLADMKKYEVVKDEWEALNGRKGRKSSGFVWVYIQK